MKIRLLGILLSGSILALLAGLTLPGIPINAGNAGQSVLTDADSLVSANSPVATGVISPYYGYACDNNYNSISETGALTVNSSSALSVIRTFPATVVKSHTFNVTITFTAPSDNFNSIGLSDFAPAGWAVSANSSWNSPICDANNVIGNQAGYVWYGPYAMGTSFTAVYQVTAPANDAGVYSFGGGILQYYGSSNGPTTANVTGDSQIQVMDGARIQGTTYESKGLILSGVTLTLDGTTQVVSGTDGTYELIGTTTGSHTVVASRTGYRSQTQIVNVTDLTATYTLDFKSGCGSVPDAPDISYVLACINKWKYPPSDGTGLDISKVLNVINAWKFPVIGGGSGGGGSPVIANSVSITPPFIIPASSPSVTANTTVTTLAADKTFTVNVNVSGVTNLTAYQFILGYDPTVIQVTGDEGMSGVIGGMIGSTNVPVDQWQFVPVGTPGKIAVLGFISARGVTGSGYLVQVHFTVVGAAGQSSSLVLSKIPGRNNTGTYQSEPLFDTLGKQIPSNLFNGSITIAP